MSKIFILIAESHRRKKQPRRWKRRERKVVDLEKKVNRLSSIKEWGMLIASRYRSANNQKAENDRAVKLRVKECHGGSWKKNREFHDIIEKQSGLLNPEEKINFC